MDDDAKVALARSVLQRCRFSAGPALAPLGAQIEAVLNLQLSLLCPPASPPPCASPFSLPFSFFFLPPPPPPPPVLPSSTARSFAPSDSDWVAAEQCM
jgi:hypothetical protein